MTLLITALIVAPAADAAVCVPEQPSAHTLIDHGMQSGDHARKGADHGVCAHGHCHHAQGERSSGDEVMIAGPYSRASHDRPRDDAAPTQVVDGLKRPPRR